MKIYNKKSFAEGIFVFVLGTLLFIMDLISHTVECKSAVLTVALYVMGKVSGDEGWIAMGIGLAFAFSISMFTELFTYMYYEGKE